jgi:hypothetical protein
MSVVEPGSARTNLVERVKGILMRPAATWEVIDTESTTVGDLYRSYVIPLAAIPAVCTAIGLMVFGVGGFGISFHFSPVWLAVQAVVSYALSLAMVYVLALIIEALAPNFGGTRDRMQAFKVAAYAPTASWVAGVFGLVPALGLIALLGALYSLYLLYLGLPRLMKTPEERTTPYFALVLVSAVVIGIVISIATSSITRMGGGMGLASAGGVSGKITVPGQGSVDLGKLEEASKRIEAAANQIEDGNAPAATDPEVLKAYLPATIAGFTRDEVQASSGGAGGLQGSTAEGTYSKGDATLRLSVTDMGAAGALAGMAGAFNVKSSNETATGYEKVGKVDGRMTQESYDRESKHGEYGMLVGDRFMIQANGDGVGMNELKAAVASIPAARLEGLAKAK